MIFWKWGGVQGRLKLFRKLIRFGRVIRPLVSDAAAKDGCQLSSQEAIQSRKYQFSGQKDFEEDLFTIPMLCTWSVTSWGFQISLRFSDLVQFVISSDQWSSKFKDLGYKIEMNLKSLIMFFYLTSYFFKALSMTRKLNLSFHIGLFCKYPFPCFKWGIKLKRILCQSKWNFMLMTAAL